MAGAAFLLALRVSRKKKNVSSGYTAQGYPLKIFLDDRKVHTLLDLSRQRGSIVGLAWGLPDGEAVPEY